jgi:hypothetical protein
VALDVSHPLKSPSKEVAPLNIEDYMMDNATKQMSVMEGKEVNYTLSLQRVNEEVANEKHHWLTKSMALDVFHPLISPLKALAPRNIPTCIINYATK